MKNWKYKIFISIMFSIVLVSVIGVFVYTQLSSEASPKYKLVDGWNVEINDKEYRNISLDEFKFPVAGKGDKIVLTGTIPSYIGPNSTLKLHMIYSVTYVYIGGEKIFEAGYEDSEQGRLLGYGATFITLPEDSQGKEIKIFYFVTENNAFSSVTPPVITDEAMATVDEVRANIATLMIDFTLILMGTFVMLITFVMFIKSFSMEKMICIGAFAVCIGFWSLCSYDMLYLFVPDLKGKAFIEFFSFYLTPLPLLLYFRQDVAAKKQKWESVLFYTLVDFCIVFNVLVFVCYLTNVMHLPEFSTIFQIYLAIGIVYILHLLIQDMFGERRHIFLVIGFAIVVILAFRDLVAYNVNKYFATTGTEGDYKSYVAFGAFAFVLSMVVEFINENRKRAYILAENEFLTKIAYQDVMTGLYTRRKSEEVFQRLNETGENFAVIEFDLNNLKTTNDVIGHEAGDELINRFAKVLKKTFSEGTFIARMGGDEFAAICQGVEADNPENCLKRLETYVAEENAMHKDVEISVSYGCCKRSEMPGARVEEIYIEADKRMYANKDQYYKNSGKGRRKSDNG